MTDATRPDPAVLAPSGRLDASAAPALRQKIADLLDSGIHNIVVDLADAPYLSSSILRVLLIGHKRTKQEGGILVLCGLQPQVLRVIQLVGFDEIFAIRPTRADALLAAHTPSPAASTRGKR